MIQGFFYLINFCQMSLALIRFCCLSLYFAQFLPASINLRVIGLKIYNIQGKYHHYNSSPIKNIEISRKKNLFKSIQLANTIKISNQYLRLKSKLVLEFSLCGKCVSAGNRSRRKVSKEKVQKRNYILTSNTLESSTHNLIKKMIFLIFYFILKENLANTYFKIS